MDNDIIRGIISTAIIKERVGSIFPDSVILDNSFRVVSISQNILDATGYAREELATLSFSVFSKTADLVDVLKEKLNAGYFADEQFEIHRKDGRSIVYSVSGFYLGVITDVNGLVVLSMKNVDEAQMNHDILEAKTAEIDRFVYNSAHRLRGPLATMKGLINLAKGYNHDDDMRFLIEQLDRYAEQLDDKLHKLIYFAESDKGYEASTKNISHADLIAGIKKSITESCVSHPMEFTCTGHHDMQVFENGEVLMSLLRNLVIFFCQQPKQANASLRLDIHASGAAVEFLLHAQGFLPGDMLNAKLSVRHFAYSEILIYPELINYYAAKKIIFKLRGEMHFVLSGVDTMTVLITLPRHVHLS
jgi:signal transduction histidine kinase